MTKHVLPAYTIWSDMSPNWHILLLSQCATSDLNRVRFPRAAFYLNVLESHSCSADARSAGFNLSAAVHNINDRQQLELLSTPHQRQDGLCCSHKPDSGGSGASTDAASNPTPGSLWQRSLPGLFCAEACLRRLRNAQLGRWHGPIPRSKLSTLISCLGFVFGVKRCARHLRYKSQAASMTTWRPVRDHQYSVPTS